MARDANGDFYVLASVTASDLYASNNDIGPGACTYEPLASNGIVIGRRYANDTRFPSLEFYISLFNTLIRP